MSDEQEEKRWEQLTANAAKKRAQKEPLTHIAAFLQEILGQRLTAYSADVRNAPLINRLANGEEGEISPRSEELLRSTYTVTLFLRGFEAPETIRAWMIGMDPCLDDQAPVTCLQAGQTEAVLTAANGLIYN